jgi:hypothetical protein
MAKLRKRNNYGVDPALFNSLYQEKKKKILQRQINRVEKRNGQLQMNLD